MKKYIFYRILFIVVTLFIIVLVNFIILHSLKVEAYNLAVMNLENNLTGEKVDLSTQLVLKKHFALNDNILIQFFKTIKNYIFFNLGKSYFSSNSVLDIILQKMKFSIPFGFISTLLIYLISSFLGYLKLQKGKIFDNTSTLVLVILYIIPTPVIASLLILFFKNSSVFNIGGMVSANFFELSFFYKIIDFFSHMFLPIIANVCGGLLFITLFAKNAFLLEKQKIYYIFAKHKGLSSFYLFKNHLLKNFLLIICSDLSSIFLGIIFGSSLFIEILFSLDGVGLLSYESLINKDYPIILGQIYLLSFLALFFRLFNDILIIIIDKRLKMYEKTF